MLDVVFVGKDRLGDVVVRRCDQLDDPLVPSLAAVDTMLGTRVNPLVTDIDAIYAAEELQPESTAALIAWQRLPHHAPSPPVVTAGPDAPAGQIPHDIARVALADLVTARTAGTPGVPVTAGGCRTRARPPGPASARRACAASSRRDP